MAKAKPQPKRRMQAAVRKPVTKATYKKGDGQWQERFLELFATSLNITLAAEGAGIHRRTAYREREKSAAFTAAWDDAKAAAIEQLEASAYERARKASDLLLIFLLKAHKPEIYRERYESVSTNLNINWGDLTDDELARIAAGEKPALVLADRSRATA